MLYPFHPWELDLVFLAEGRPPLPGTGPLITSDMWRAKWWCLRPSDLRNKRKAEVTGVNRAVAGAGGAGWGGLGSGEPALDVSAACRAAWGEGGDPTASLPGPRCTCAWPGSPRSRSEPLGSVSPSVHNEAGLPPSLSRSENLHSRSSYQQKLTRTDSSFCARIVLSSL